MAHIQLRDVRKTFGAVDVIKGIDLEIRKGEFMVFVGPSGCGKSTLLRLIAGLEPISDGDLAFDGARMNDLAPSRRGIAMVFQSYALYPHMKIYDNMAFGMTLAKSDPGEIRRRVQKAAEMLQIDHLLDRLPKQLSGGQRQRVAIGRAIVRDPRVFLFDEPLSNLDAALRVATRIEIAQLKERMPNSTMIYVTHDQVEAMTLASRIVVLSAGNIEQVGAPLELYERPANIFVARFIGSPAMNILPAKVVETGERAGVQLPSGSIVHLDIPLPGAAMGETVSLGVRPEDMVPTDGETIFAGNIALVEALGENTVLYFETESGKDPFIAKLPGIQRFDRGQTVRLGADRAKLHLFDAAGKSFLYR